MEGLLSVGPTPSSFKIVSFLKPADIQNLLISACSGPFLVIKKSKLMRIKFQRDWNRLEVPQIANLRMCGRGPLCTFSKVRRCNQEIFF